MSHSFYKIWLHIVFSTKNHENYLISNIDSIIFNYLQDQYIELGCKVKIINGMPDHVHCLIQQNPNKSIAEIIKQIKGASSHWINQNNIIPFEFSWQTGYGVFSVSESQIDKVYKYIKEQKKHHIKVSFQEEYIAFLKLHKINFEG
jgi:putative transposase